MAGAAAYDNWPNDYVIISLARDANQGLVDGDSGEVSLRKRRSRANYPALVVKRQRNAEEELIHQLDRSETFRRTLNLYRKIKLSGRFQVTAKRIAEAVHLARIAVESGEA